MSFFDDASLAFLPSGAAGKDGKAYSIKPTDGTGDFTFSRGSNLAATRVGADGLIEKGRENLFTESNQFDTNWTRVDISAPTSGESGYDGSSDAWLLTKTGTSFDYLRRDVSNSSVKTFSLYAKAGTLGGVRLSIRGASQSDGLFNLTSGGSVISTTGGIDATIERVGLTDWYRVSVTDSQAATNFRIYPITSAGAYDTTGTIYIQDAQLEIGLAATDYIESGATTGKAGLLEDEPRFDYSGGATCPSLLLEPSRTNLIEYSEYLNSGWTYARSSSSLSSFVSPDGDVKSYKFVENLDTNKSFYIYQRPTSVSGQTYTQSIFAKAGERDWLKVELDAKYAYFDLTNGLIGSTSASTTANIEQLSNGWYRCSVSAITTSTAPYIAYYLAIADGDSIYDGDGTSGLYLWGGQYEEGSYPTSYIPNHSGGSVTRGEDDCFKTGVSDLIGQTEGTLFLDFIFDSEDGSEDFRFQLSDGASASDWIFVGIANGFLRAYVRYTNVVQFDTGSFPATIGTRYKIALAYAANDFAAYINGSQKVTSSSGTIPATNAISLGNTAFTTASVLKERVNQALLFKERLSNADLETLTTL